MGFFLNIDGVVERVTGLSAAGGVLDNLKVVKTICDNRSVGSCSSLIRQIQLNDRDLCMFDKPPMEIQAALKEDNTKAGKGSNNVRLWLIVARQPSTLSTLSSSFPSTSSLLSFVLFSSFSSSFAPSLCLF
ncbi:hypothetical protein Gotur_029504 [Gossypium turneri]